MQNRLAQVLRKDRHVMILGLSTSMFTTVHVIISLIGIASGAVVLFGMFTNRWFAGWTAFFCHHCTHERDRLLLSLRELRAAPCDSCDIAGDFSSRDRGALRLSTRRFLALDLRFWCRGGSLSERIRRGRTGVPKASSPSAAGTDAIRAAFCGRSGYRAGDLCCAWHRSREEFFPKQ
jgi:hypothetical protein